MFLVILIFLFFRFLWPLGKWRRSDTFSHLCDYKVLIVVFRLLRWFSQKWTKCSRSMKSDSLFATKVIVSFHHSFSYKHYLSDKPMTYSDLSPLLWQDVSFSYSTPRWTTASKPPKSLFRPSLVCFPCSQVSLKPASGPVLALVPSLIEYQLDRIRDGRWNQFGIPSFLCPDTFPHLQGVHEFVSHGFDD
jgi:hypothetical protein